MCLWKVSGVEAFFFKTSGCVGLGCRISSLGFIGLTFRVGDSGCRILSLGGFGGSQRLFHGALLSPPRLRNLALGAWGVLMPKAHQKKAKLVM